MLLDLIDIFFASPQLRMQPVCGKLQQLPSLAGLPGLWEGQLFTARPTGPMQVCLRT